MLGRLLIYSHLQERKHSFYFREQIHSTLSGDCKYKPWVTEEPDLIKVELDGTEDFLIVACDGFWERATEDIVASLLYEYVGSGMSKY
uniref:PPM-type phosphatase domain-containing protein n=1 Tax=Trichogramma kaykai TaxID=54128 RepID=A0ABD2WIN7_9HYME